MMETKVCRTCGYEQPIENFSPKKKAQGGRNPICKACVNAEYRMKHPPKDPSMVSNKHRNYGIQRTETERGTTLVQFGDKAPQTHSNRKNAPRGMQSSIRLFDNY